MGVVVTSATPRVSVVIPTYQRCASLKRALEALTAQTMRPTDFEVVVSVDGSTDGTRDMLAEFEAPYRVVTHWQPNRGRAAACNAGIHQARGALIVLLDDDMQPAPEFLQAHASAHNDGRRRAVSQRARHWPSCCDSARLGLAVKSSVPSPRGCRERSTGGCGRAGSMLSSKPSTSWRRDTRNSQSSEFASSG